jgi:hypothetical protein
MLKKTLPCILIIAILLGIFYAPLSVHRANAFTGLPDLILAIMGKKSVAEMTAKTLAPYIGNAIAEVIAWLAYWGLFKPARWLMGMAGNALNLSVDLSVRSDTLGQLANTRTNDAPVAVGWRLSRDIVNLFLIFILLYIAIATILQVPGYGYKELLATLIIIAFLVNFSLVICKMIIDASNILALEFLNKFAGPNREILIADRFMQAFEVTRIDQPPNNLANFDSGKILLVYIFGAAIMLIGGFIFLVGAVLLLIRLVMLALLMILAPLAFAAMILPATKGYASKWWSYLFNQAFFAPTFLFMIYFAAMVANSGFLQRAVSGNTAMQSFGNYFDPQLLSAAGVTQPVGNFAFFVNFILVAIFLIASIVIAKMMGAMGADVTMRGLKKVGLKAQGYAGRVSKRYAAGTAEAIMASEGKAARFIKKVPLVSRGLARVTVAGRKEVADYEKKYDSYSDASLKQLHQQIGTNRSARMAIMNILSKRGNLKEEGAFTGQQIKQTLRYSQSLGLQKEVKDIIRQKPELASPEFGIEMREAVASQRAEDIAKIDKSLARNAPFLEAAVAGWKPGHIQKLVERGDEVFEEYINTLKELAGGSEKAADIANALRAKGNLGTARWVESDAGMALLGFKPSPPPPPPSKPPKPWETPL